MTDHVPVDSGHGDDKRAVMLSTVALQAAAFDIKTHPNKMPFSGVLTYIDEPSDAAPEGTGGKRILVTAGAARDALDSLIGMGIGCMADLTAHAPRNKIGVISAADIKQVNGRNAIVVDGYIFAADFPELAKEIKANKDDLGMSFEARNLWTNDPKLNPVSVTELVFTGAAILFKNKAAYKSTSINAAQEAAERAADVVAHLSDQGDFKMDAEAQKNFDALAASVKQIADAVTAQATQIAELQKLPEKMANVQAANVLEKVEPHAKRLEDAANKLEDAGIGLHASAGHVQILRKMADGIRADGAVGKVSHVFDRFMASDAAAVKAGEDAAAKAKVEADKQIAEVKAAAEKAEVAHKDEVASLKTKLADAEKKIETLSASAEGVRPARQTLAYALSAGEEKLIAKAGIELPKDGSKIPLNTLNDAMAKAGLATEDRFRLKTVLAHVGAID